MQTLTYGLKNPENGDKGSVFFPALNFDITQLDAHNHDGVTSRKLTTASLTNTTQAILAVNWAAVGDGTGRFSQVVTMPGTLTYDSQVIYFKTTTTKDPLLLDYEKVTANSFRVYINDNTLDITVIYI